MNRIFGKGYSDAYDLLYDGKDYAAECDEIEKILRQNSRIPVHSILDLGCGTGSHALRLAERGYDVTGVDRSGSMLGIARAKAEEKKIPCTFFRSDIRTFENGAKYDAVIMMFAVLSYQQENRDVLAALKTVAKHLDDGGVFVCDAWYGPAVLHQKPGTRTREIVQGNVKIIRESNGILDTFHHLVRVHFQLKKTIGGQIENETCEDHVMRFFFPQELVFLFQSAGLCIRKITAFPNVDQEPSDATWDVCIISKR